MESVIIALGSNLGDRLGYLKKAGRFLENLSGEPVEKASIWESEPIGKAKYTFYNTAAKITTLLSPEELLIQLKSIEQACGRRQNPVRWGPRRLDLDIICFGNLVIERDTLIIPHPEYKKRLFVLMPMEEIDSSWNDPATGESIRTLIETAPRMDIQKTELAW